MDMTKEDDEYGAAFNKATGGAQDMPPEEPMPEGGAVEPAPEMAEEEVAELADAVGAEGESLPDEAAAEGATETDAVAVTTEAPEDFEQKYKTLKGKYDAETQALREKLAALEAGEQEEAGEPAEAQEEGADEQLGEAPIDSEAAASISERLKSRARELVGSGEIETILQSGVEAYGEDFFDQMAAVAALMHGDMVGEVEGRFGGRIEDLVSEVQRQFASQHFNTISDAHEDFDTVVESPEFAQWVESLPDEDQAKTREIIERGSASRVIKMLQAFKDSREQGEDIDDAAMGVHSSTAVRLPSPAGGDPDDEYSRAWNDI